MSATVEDTKKAIAQVHGQEQGDKGIGQWIWEALQGDFAEERSAGQIGFDMAVSFIPIVDTICDVRDLCANIRQYNKDPDNKITLLFIGLTVIGFVPEIGSIVKGCLKIFFAKLRPYLKHADDITDAGRLMKHVDRALDAALPKITEFLQNNQVIKWATKNKVPDLFSYLAKQLRELAKKIDRDNIKKAFDEAIDAIRILLRRIHSIVPADTAGKIEDFLAMLDRQAFRIKMKLHWPINYIRSILLRVAERLDDHAWIAYSRNVNKGWIAPMTESGAASLMRREPPAWVRLGNGKYDKLSVTDGKKLMARYPNHPKLGKEEIQSFHAMRADTLKGPTKLYRVIDPTNEGAGIFWMSEKEFKSLKNRGQWRDRFAVKPDWNQNGQYVVYELKEGETLNAWRGPLSSQELKGTPYHLQGGGEQIVFFPNKGDDTLRDAMTRGSEQRYNTDTDAFEKSRGVRFTDVAGESVDKPLRQQINVPSIRGPFDSGWGYADWTEQQAQRIIVTLREIAD